MKSLQEMPSHARVWVYMANTTISNAVVEEINQKAEIFLAGWNTHGTGLDASIEILYDRFIVVMVDEDQAKASGCSIDKSVHFVQEVESFYNLDLMNRQLVGYRKGEELKTATLKEFGEMVKSGELTADTIVFNNIVGNKAEFFDNWEANLEDTWLNRYLPN